MSDHLPFLFPRRSAAHLAVQPEQWTQLLADVEPVPPPEPPAAGLEAPVIEDFRPLTRSLEWRVSAAYWHENGVLPFAQQEVPFAVNNSGRMSDSAAVLLFASCMETPPGDVLTVVEFGAGSGLFARHFLDAFAALCRQEKQDFYQRLQLVVTDASPATVAHWHQLGLFRDHAGHVRAAVADAVDGPPVQGPVRAAFCNYVLDVLPAANLRRAAGGGAEQLCVRTHLQGDPALVQSYTPLTLPQIREIAASERPSDLAALFPLLSLFEQQVAFRPEGVEAIPAAAEALADLGAGGSVRLNHGAWQCLERTAETLEPGGFILINDYGWTRPEQARSTCERYGKTTALGINFPLLEQRLQGGGLQVLAPSGDHEQRLHSRLVTRAPLPRTARAFESRFGQEGSRHHEEPIEQARAHKEAGRIREAYTAYETAMARSPRNWALILEAAEFVTYRLRAYPPAVMLCQAAIGLNPFFSARLWRVLGDALFGLGRFEPAHRAYLQAERINPADGRVKLALARSFDQRGEHASALRVIAQALAGNVQDDLAARLLSGQQLALQAITARAKGEKERLARRTRRFAAAGKPPTPVTEGARLSGHGQ